MYICVYVYMYVCIPAIFTCLQRPEEGARFSRAIVIDDCELPDLVVMNQAGVQWKKQQAFLALSLLSIRILLTLKRIQGWDSVIKRKGELVYCTSAVKNSTQSWMFHVLALWFFCLRQIIDKHVGFTLLNAVSQDASLLPSSF